MPMVSTTPAELFLFVALDVLRSELGFDDLAGAAAILLGQNDVLIPGKLAGAVPGTSVISIASRKMLPFNIAMRLPTLTRSGTHGLRMTFTRNLGAFVGRAIPVAGVVLLSTDVFIVMRKSVAAYNRLVKPEDRVF